MRTRSDRYIVIGISMYSTHPPPLEYAEYTLKDNMIPLTGTSCLIHTAGILLKMENQHGHWACWKSMVRKNG